MKSMLQILKKYGELASKIKREDISITMSGKLLQKGEITDKDYKFIIDRANRITIKATCNQEILEWLVNDKI